MMKCFLICFGLLVAPLYAEEQEATLSAKIMFDPSIGFYSLSDGSIWKVMSVTPRWRTISEWWYNVHIVPEHFECSIDDFCVGAKIKIMPRCEFEAFNDEFIGNKEALAQCSHIFINTETNKCIFGMGFKSENALLEVCHEAYKFGYTYGYDDGYHDGKKKG